MSERDKNEDWVQAYCDDCGNEMDNEEWEENGGLCDNCSSKVSEEKENEKEEE